MIQLTNEIIIEKATVSELLKILKLLSERGYGDVPIIRADIESGPLDIRGIALYDTRLEKERGELNHDNYFLIA